MNLLGIDLGNANSVGCALVADEVRAIPAADTGAAATPSVVAFTAGGQALVGAAAQRQMAANPGRTYCSFVRRLGERGGPADPAEPAAARLVTLLLGKLRQDAEAYLGEPAGDAVITVPATATHRYQLALVAAAEQAGLRVLGTLAAPTAAALAYGGSGPGWRRLLAVDLGARTLGMSLVEASGSAVEVRATVGEQLGGADWDERIVAHLSAAAVTEHGIDLSRDLPALRQLAGAAERAKVELSSAQTAALDLPYLATRSRGPLSLYAELTRAELDRLARDLLDRCADLYHRVARAGEADRVVLVGAASRMPAVHALLRRVAGSPPYRGVAADLLVAEGASRWAGILAGGQQGAALVDVARLPLAIQARGGLAIPLVKAGAALPASGSATFTTVRDDQRSALVHLVQGESEIAARNTSLGWFELTGFGPAPCGVPRIEVTVTADGTVRATARDLRSRRSQSLTVTAATAAADPPAVPDPVALTLAG